MKTNKFLDVNNETVSIGDKVHGHNVNEWLEGIVIELDPNVRHKPFKIITDDNEVYCMNAEWTKKAEIHEWASDVYLANQDRFDGLETIDQIEAVVALKQPNASEENVKAIASIIYNI